LAEERELASNALHRTIEFSGNAGIGVYCTGSGVRDIRSSRLVMLVE